MEITFTPPASAVIAAPSLVFIHCEDAAADIFFTLDGSVPTSSSTPYTGKLTLLADQTLKAIAIRGDCESAVTAASYTFFDDATLKFQFICDGDNDKAGVFYEFAPNGTANDYHWRVKFNHPQAWYLHTLEVYETDKDGVWVSGQAWATKTPTYPPEIDPDSFAIYPLVLFSGGLQLNNAYDDELSLLQSPATDVQFEGYGQPFVPLVGYFRLAMTIQVAGGDPITVQRVISHECATCEDDDTTNDTVDDCLPIPFVTAITNPGDLVTRAGSNIPGVYLNGFFMLVGAADISLTHLGRWVISGNDKTHRLVISGPSVDGPDFENPIAEVTIDTNGATPGAFLYGQLVTPVTLQAGGTYWVYSYEDSTDVFYGPDGPPIVTTTAVAAVLGWSDDTSNGNGADGYMYGPLDFKYCTPT